MQQEFIQVDHINKTYGDISAVEDVSFSIPAGEIVAIVGPNGSGKSTLVKMMAGLITPTSGTITIDGKPPAQARKKLAYVPQHFSFDKTLPITIKEFLLIALETETETPAHTRVINALSFVGLTDQIDKQLGTLSGGQLQRVLIARAILEKKQLLILDEPSSGIDVSAEQEIHLLLKAMNVEYGTTIVIISHELDFVSSFAHSVLCLNKQKVCYGAVVDMLTNPEILHKLYGTVVPMSQHKHDHI